MIIPAFFYSEPPGCRWNGYRHFSASVTVSDPDGNPIGGVEVQLLAIIYGSEGDGSDLLWGTTTTNGWVNLSTTVYYEGWEEGHFMSVSISDDRYTVISSSNTSSSVSYTLYPDFDVVLDVDQNGINDEWELLLAEKFCPYITWEQPWLTILGIGVWDSYAAAGYDIRQETKMAPLGPPAKANTWNKVYNETGLTVYTKR